MDSPKNTRPSSFRLERLNFIRLLICLVIAFGYSSTIAAGSTAKEWLTHFGVAPSWLGIQLLFFLSGFLALASLTRHRSIKRFFISRAQRTLPTLFAFTLAVVVILYPLFATNPELSDATIQKLIHYSLLTISCIDPGRPLPGFLDEAKYHCMIQGAAWTLRWGALLFLMTAAAWRIGVFRSQTLLLVGAIASTCLYIGLQYYAVATHNAALTPMVTGLRLGYIFMWGVAAFAWQDVLMLRRHQYCAAGFTLSTVLILSFCPWTPAIEVMLTLFWTVLIWIGLTGHINNTPTWVRHVPHLAIGVYLSNWPISQLLLFTNPNLSVSITIILTLSISLLTACLTYFALNGQLIVKSLNTKIRI